MEGYQQEKREGVHGGKKTKAEEGGRKKEAKRRFEEGKLSKLDQSPNV